MKPVNRLPPIWAAVSREGEVVFTCAKKDQMDIYAAAFKSIIDRIVKYIPAGVVQYVPAEEVTQEQRP